MRGFPFKLELIRIYVFFKEPKLYLPDRLTQFWSFWKTLVQVILNLIRHCIIPCNNRRCVLFIQIVQSTHSNRLLFTLISQMVVYSYASRIYFILMSLFPCYCVPSTSSCCLVHTVHLRPVRTRCLGTVLRHEHQL